MATDSKADEAKERNFENRRLTIRNKKNKNVEIFAVGIRRECFVVLSSFAIVRFYSMACLNEVKVKLQMSTL